MAVAVTHFAPMESAPKLAATSRYEQGPVVILLFDNEHVKPPKHVPARWVSYWGHGGWGYWKFLEPGSVSPDNPCLRGWCEPCAVANGET